MFTLSKYPTTNTHTQRLIEQRHSCADCARPGICAQYAPEGKDGRPDRHTVCPEWRGSFKHEKAA